MKWWLPHHEFQIASSLSPAEAMQALAAHVEPEKVFRWRIPSSKNDERFEGEIGNGAFRVRRVIGYRNSFLPVVIGIVTPNARGSTIAIRMRLFVIVYIFLPIWAVGMSAALLSYAWPLAIVVVLLAYAMTTGGFWFEASKQEKVLRSIFQAR